MAESATGVEFQIRRLSIRLNWVTHSTDSNPLNLPNPLNPTNRNASLY